MKFIFRPSHFLAKGVDGVRKGKRCRGRRRNKQNERSGRNRLGAKFDNDSIGVWKERKKIRKGFSREPHT